MSHWKGLTPVRHIVTERNTSFAQSCLRYSLKMKLVPRLPMMYPKKPKDQTRLMVAMSTPVFCARKGWVGPTTVVTRPCPNWVSQDTGK